MNILITTVQFNFIFLRYIHCFPCFTNMIGYERFFYKVSFLRWYQETLFRCFWMHEYGIDEMLICHVNKLIICCNISVCLVFFLLFHISLFNFVNVQVEIKSKHKNRIYMNAIIHPSSVQLGLKWIQIIYMIIEGKPHERICRRVKQRFCSVTGLHWLGCVNVAAALKTYLHTIFL